MIRHGSMPGWERCILRGYPKSQASPPPVFCRKAKVDVPFAKAQMNAPVLVEATLLGDYERYLATKPAHTRDAYLHDVATLRALVGEVPLAGLSPVDLRRFLATLHGRGISG